MSRNINSIGTKASTSRHRREGHDAHNLALPEAIAITLLIVFAGIVCSGWFNVMLPWSG